MKSVHAEGLDGVMAVCVRCLMKSVHAEGLDGVMAVCVRCLVKSVHAEGLDGVMAVQALGLNGGWTWSKVQTLMVSLLVEV